MKLGKIGMLLAALALLAGSVFGANAAAVESQDSQSDVAVTVPSGSPLTEGEIIILLQAKVPVEVIQKFVQTRGVGFAASKETGRKIIGAGGNVALVGTISLNQKELPGVAANSAPEETKRKK